MLVIEEVKTPAQIQAVRELLITYAKSRGFDAALGDFDKELATLPGKYGPPEGALLLAKWQGKEIGCVAFQKIGENICEMKRMYVDPDYRGKRIGKSLIEALIEMAQSRPYEIMRLDTHPTMTTAQALYQSMGFKEIDRYNDNPTPGVRFFECLL